MAFPLRLLPIFRVSPSLAGTVSLRLGSVTVASILPEHFEAVTGYPVAEYKSLMEGRKTANANNLVAALTDVSPALGEWAKGALTMGRTPEDVYASIHAAVLRVDAEKAGK